MWLLEQAPSRSRAPIWLFVVVAGVAGFVESIRSIVSSVGWIEAGGAGGGLVLILLSWLGWAEWRRARMRDHISVNEGIVVPIHTLRTLTERIKAIERERRHYERELFSVAHRSMRPVSEAIRIRYEIGSNPLGDRTTVFHESTADDPNLPIRWVVLKAWSDANAAKVPSFRDLLDVEAFEIDPRTGDEIPMRLLDIGAHDRAICALALFNPELTTAPRRWQWSYTWPGMWNPLRQRNLDWTEYDPRVTVNSPYRVKSLTITFIFPTAAVEPIVRPGRDTPACGEDADPTGGRRAFTVRIDNPKDVLHWDLAVSAWEIVRSHVR